MVNVEKKDVITKTTSVVITLDETMACKLAALLGAFGKELGMSPLFDKLYDAGMNYTRKEYDDHQKTVEKAIKFRATQQW